MDLTTFRALSFDCYGTLIDWETGMLDVLRPWAAEVGLAVDDEQLLRAYGDGELAAELYQPGALYPAILADAFRRAGTALGRQVDDAWATRLGHSIPQWPAFPDSKAALALLAEQYRLIILSNVNRAGFAGSNEQLQGTFAAVITAEDVGAYKPADNHFDALDRTIAELGIEQHELLHVAQSLYHDHVPAHRRGLHSVWINRRHGRAGLGATPQPVEEFSYDLEFASMQDFASAVEAAFGSSTAGQP